MKLKLLIPALTLLLIINSCHESGVDAYGPIVAEIREVNTFTSMNVSLPADVYIIQGTHQSVYIKTHEDILPHIDSYVNDGELILDLNRNIRNIDKLEIYITAVEYERIRLSGAANLRSEICLNLDNLDVRISGASKVNLCGTVDALDIYISGAGDFRGYDMVAQEANVQVSGAANVRVTAEQVLDARISGAGNVRYKGSPQVFSDVSGAGSLINAN